MTKDDLIDELLLKVKEKREEVSKIKNPVFKTNMSFPYNTYFAGIDQPMLKRINLHAASTEILISLLAHVNGLITAKNEIDIKDEDIGLWYIYPLEDWKKDIISRIRQNTGRKKSKELSEIEQRLLDLMSNEKKWEIEYQKLKKELGI